MSYDETLRIVYADPANENDGHSTYIIESNNDLLYMVVIDTFRYRYIKSLKWREIVIQTWFNHKWNICFEGKYTVTRDIKNHISMGVKANENIDRYTMDFYLTWSEYVDRSSNLLYVETLDKYFTFGEI